MAPSTWATTRRVAEAPSLFCYISKLITIMAKSITKMARVAIDLFEPRKISKNRIHLREFSTSDTFVEVSEAKAMSMLVSFVFFQVIGKRLEKIGWEEEAFLYGLIKDLSAQVETDSWEFGISLQFEIFYNSREVIRKFINYIHYPI